MSLEVPLEEQRYLEKQEMAKQILEDMDFLPESYWRMIHHPRPENRYNYLSH